MLDRTYDSKETKEIWVYGLDDKDVFEVRGKVDNPVFIRIIGGQNNDVYKISNGREIKVYEKKRKKNNVEEKDRASFRFTNNYDLNVYDLNRNIQSINLFLPSLGYNHDHRFQVGVSNTYTVNDFHRNPYSQQHRLPPGYY